MINAVVTRYPALGHKHYLRYWLASFFSVGATQLVTLGQAWLVFRLTGSALDLGYLGAAAAVPNIVMTFVGGVVADRFDKRFILLCTTAFTALLLSVLATLVATDTVMLWHVLTIAALVSFTTGLEWPVRVAIYPKLVDRSSFMSAVALNAFIWQATRMAIPAAGGILIAFYGTAIVFALAAVGCLVMFSVMLFIPIKSEEAHHESPVRQMVAGVRFIVHTPLFRWLITLTFVGMLFANSHVQLLPVFASLLGEAETGYGYLMSAGGVGAVAGSLLMGAFGEHRRLGLLMLGAAAVSILALYGFSAVAAPGGFPVAMVLLFLVSAFSSAFMISSMTVLQLAVPDALRGRVMGIHTIGYSLVPLGGLVLGAAAEALGAPLAVAVGATVYLLFLGVTTLSQPHIRDLDGERLGEAQSDRTAGPAPGTGAAPAALR